MSNQPIYRYPPRSHAYNCPCPRCTQVRASRKGSAGTSGAWIWPLILVLGTVSWAIGAAARHPLVIAAAGAGIVFLALVTWAVVALNRWESARLPEGRLRAETLRDGPASGPPMSSLPPAPLAPPICLHRNAVRVASRAWPQETLENYCPDCDARLGAGFTRACCGAPPGDSPGAGHLYNCPYRKGTRR